MNGQKKIRKRLDKLNKQGFRPVDIEVSGGDERRYSIIWRKDNRGWKLRAKLLAKALSQEVANSKGYLPIDIETYVFKGNRYYAILWIKNAPKRKWFYDPNIGHRKLENHIKEKFILWLPIIVIGVVSLLC